jgi:hypothetical protein
MKYELQLQMNFRSAFGELKRQTKDNVSCSDTSFLYFEVENLMKRTPPIREMCRAFRYSANYCRYNGSCGSTKDNGR